MKHRALRDLGCLLAAATAASFASCHGKGTGADRVPVSTFNPGFSLRQDVQLGSGSVNEALVADLDGDGLDDFLEADFFDQRIRAAISNPDGSFTPFFELVTPSTPWQLDLGDYDGDGERDIATICTAATGGIYALVVYRGLGDGSFVQDAVLELPAEPYDLATGRLGTATHDSLFVVMPFAQETLHVELTAPGVLTELASLSSSDATTFSPITVTVVDADGDTFRDVIVGEMNFVNPGTGADRIVRHVFDGVNFLPPVVQEPIAAYPIVRAVGDADLDGFEDLGVAQLESDRALLLRGSATGLQPPIEIPFTGTSASIVFADMNGDGVKDVAASLYDSDAIGVRLATAPLSFPTLDLYNVGGRPRSVAVGEFGQGPDVDLFCSNFGDVSILRGIGAGQFDAARGFPVGNDPLFVRTVDLDGDGELDVVSMDLFKGKVVFMRGNGDGTFANAGQIPLSASTLEWPGFLVVGDFDEDGLPDVATAINNANMVQVMRNPGTLPFGLPTAQDQVAVGVEPVGLDTGDLDGDGHLDIVVANSGNNTVQVLLGRGDATFDARGGVASAFSPLVVSVGDWNGDGHPDAAVTTRDEGTGTSHLMLYRGDGSGDLFFAAQQELPRFTPVLEVGDFDEDGLPDLACSQPALDADDVLVLMNDGDFGFTVTTLEVGFRMGTLEVIDANLDGHDDILVPLGHGQLVIALGDGAGHFPVLLPPNGEQFPAPRGATTSAMADVNGDGKPDLLCVSPDNPHLWVALNEGEAFQ